MFMKFVLATAFLLAADTFQATVDCSCIEDGPSIAVKVRRALAVHTYGTRFNQVACRTGHNPVRTDLWGRSASGVPTATRISFSKSINVTEI